MGKRVIIAVLVAILFVPGCNKLESKETIGKEKYVTELSVDIRNPAVYIGVLENGEILYYYIEKDKAVISSYNFFSGNKKIIGEINNYYLDSGSAVLLDENVYFFAAVIEDKKVKNELFRIDIKEKTIDKYEKKEDNSLPGLSIQQIEKKLITLKNEREGDEIITYLEVFDPKTGIWEKVDEKNIMNELIKEVRCIPCAQMKNSFMLSKMIMEKEESLKVFLFNMIESSKNIREFY